MAGNPIGFVQSNDFGNPKVLTGTAREVISGGQFVGVSGATGVVSSGLSSYASSDIAFYVADAAENVVGVALNTVASGADLGVAVDGVILAKCGGSVFAGYLLEKLAADDAVQNLGSQVIPASAEDSSIAGKTIGRAYTAGASGGFALVRIKP